MFWVWIVLAVLVIVGATVLAAKMLTGGGKRRVTPERQAQITALKASGALRHRKSNRP
jgi:hypothetical protein